MARNLIDAFDFLTYRIATHTMDRLLCVSTTKRFSYPLLRQIF